MDYSRDQARELTLYRNEQEVSIPSVILFPGLKSAQPAGCSAVWSLQMFIGGVEEIVVFSSTLIPLGTVYTPDSILGSIIKHVYYTPTSWGRQGCQLKAGVMKDLDHH